MSEIIYDYDYIVIGSGPAGATIAKTLSDDRRNSVLILEAGENNDNDVQIRNSTFAPVLSNLFFPQYFWQGEGVPQDDVNNRIFRWTGGRLLGGSSSVNRQLYVRPTPAVLREWQRLLGPIWSPEEATKQFKELERFNGITDNPEAHGFEGPLDVRQAPVQPTMMADKLVSAIEQATGFNEILDYNNPFTPIGPFTRNQYTQKPDGTRASSSSAFLSSNIVDAEGNGVNGRKLKVLTKSTALRIIFHHNTAVGVKIIRDGQCNSLYARKKIIVSAGIKSPKLLMHSGIGPCYDLKKAGIPLIYCNTNVGRHLSNHTIIAAAFSTNPEDNAIPPDDPNAHLIAGAFLPDPRCCTDSMLRAIQLEPFPSGNTLIVGISPIQPKSRGTIEIQTNDPLKIELGNEEFLDNPIDLLLLKDTFRLYIKKIALKLNAIDPKYQLISPTLDVINNDDQLENFILQNLSLTFHEQSTLRMAASPDSGVVNFRGEVFGVRNLIVADNSIIPFIVDGNTSAAAYLIGLTIACQILTEADGD